MKGRISLFFIVFKRFVPFGNLAQSLHIVLAGVEVDKKNEK